MKMFENIYKDMIVSLSDGRLDHLQFAYQSGKGVAEAKHFILDSV